MPFKKILIANRGEIALRVIRACKKMKISSIAVFSDADADTRHVREADQAVNIGPAISRKSYLNVDAIIDAAKRTGADAIHPGYGFLSENADFARACRDNRIVFIGPSAECIDRAGNKSAARSLLTELGEVVIPGSDDVIASPEQAFQVAEAVGYPVILKASGGGGGRGMRLAHDREALSTAFVIARGEAQAAFGNPDLYLEKYIESPRHIEIQILGDAKGNYIALGERECSIQMRYQKLIEEAPSPFVDATLRKKLSDTAIRVARSIGYTNAGTMEFLVDKHRNYYFMEVNARVQVEHPITEMITGVDIVEQQILLAEGNPLTLKPDDIQLDGWALECRINANDPDDNFMPSPGKIEQVIFPKGPGVRLDTFIENNTLVTPFYDSLLGKLVVWGPDRETAIERMMKALDDFSITGIKTIIPFHRSIINSKDFRNGDIDTHFLDRISCD